MRISVRLAVCLVALAGLLVGPGNAFAAGDLVIGQVYGGGGNSGATYTNDFIEVFNRGTTTVSLTGLSVQYASATGTGNFGANPVTTLSGSLGPGQYYLVQLAGGSTGVSLPTPDATGTVNMSGTAGKVILADTTGGIACNGGSTPCSAAQLALIVDLVGYGGANFFEGASAAPALSNTTAAFRNDSGCTDTDNNGADFTAVAPSPRNTLSPLHFCARLPSLSVGDVTIDEGNSGTTIATFTVSLSAPAGAGGVSYDIATADGTATTASGDYVASSLTGRTIPAGSSTATFDVTVNGDTAPEPNETFFVNVTNVAGADVADAKGLGTVANDDVMLTPIHQIQGSGLTTPLAGQTVAIEGVVVGDYQLTPSEFNGFYVQEEDGDVDVDPATSEGVFVFAGGVDVNVGDVVRVRGTAGEFSGLTQLSSVTSVTIVSTGTAVTPAGVSLPVAEVSDLEQYEGMRVNFAQTLTVTEVFNLGRFGEVSLSGAGRLYTPTAVANPGPDAQAVLAQNNRSRIILDDANNRQNIDPTRYPQGGLSATNTLRVGDTLAGLTGVMDFRFSNYRIQPVSLPLDFVHTNPRPAAPSPVGGNFKIASFNVLNYFNGDGTGGGFPTSRGANTLAEFQRQRAKEISALTAMNADVVGLMEMENDANPNSAVGDLVSGLNDATAPGTYAYVDTGVIGTDEIKVALIYKPASVTPAGEWKIITSAVDPRFIDTRNRPSLAQTFRDNATGRKLTIVVNHLKSKGSACDGDPDTGDGSGNCNQTRTNAAAAIVDWLKTDPTGSGDSDFLLIGDMNSYTFEMPITTFEVGGFTNLVRREHGLAAYSYVFNGESGYLDHALATSSLAAQVTGVTDWHINPDEPTVLDYNVEFKTPNQVDTFYSPDPYRSSDHDPIVVGIGLAAAPTANAGGPYTVAEGASTTLTGTGSGAGTLSYAWDLDADGTFETAGSTATFSAAALDGPTSRQVKLRVSDGELSVVAIATVDVTNVAPTATFTSPVSVFAGNPIALSLTSPLDPSAADTAAGFTYAFDCGSGLGAFTTTATTSCATSDTGVVNVQGVIRDKDGGLTSYSASVSVTVTGDSLCTLTRSYVANDGVASSLCAKLASGSYAAFVNEVDAQTGKLLTAAQAALLKRLAGRL